ncbi:MAG: GlsB/YeaQ/YmgE family stress response membrane protein [Burkholderiaceae bacterium]
MEFIWMIIIGFVVGLVARAILPGAQKLGLILTTVLGIAGSFAAGLAGRALGWYATGDPVGFIASVIGAIVLLLIVSKLKSSSS